MKKVQKIDKVNIFYKNDKLAKQKLIDFIIQYLLENNFGRPGDVSGK